MVLLAGWPEWGDAVVMATGAVLVWALALYLISRAPPRRVPVLAAAAMLLLASYQMGEALGALAPDPAGWAEWLRRTWWAPALAPPTWFVLTIALAEAEGAPPLAEYAQRAFWPLAVVLAALGAAFAALGVLTPLVQNWGAPYVIDSPLRVGPTSLRHAPPGPLFAAFQVFALVCLVAAAIVMASLWATSPRGTPLRARFAWLVGSAGLFLFGGVWVVIGSGIFGFSGLPGHVVVIVGMLILGYTLARYGALLAGEQVTADFIAFGLAMLVIVGTYTAIIIVLAPPDFGWLERALPLLFVVMTTHVIVDTRGHLLDRVLYGALVSNLRGQLRELSNRVVRQPDSVAALVDVRETVDDMLRERTPHEVDMRVLVEGALRHLNDLPGLSQHPLLERLPATADRVGTPLERASGLRNELEQAIERLRPPGPRPTPGTSNIGGWLHYLVLREAYVDGRANKQIMQRYALSEGTFHRARRRAIDAVATDIAQRTTHAAALPGARGMNLTHGGMFGNCGR